MAVHAPQLQAQLQRQSSLSQLTYFPQIDQRLISIIGHRPNHRVLHTELARHIEIFLS